MSLETEAKIQWRNIIVVICALIAIMIVIFSFIITTDNPVKFKIHCNVDQIKYGLIPPARCWLPDVTPQNCPLPGKIDCEIEGEAPASFIRQEMIFGGIK